MTEILSVANQKGGVSKTTTALNLGAVLAFVYGMKVLLVDIDPQGNLTDNVGIDIEAESVPTMYEILKGEDRVEDGIMDYNGIDVLTADIALSSAEREFTQVGAEHRLRKALAPIKDRYDYIIIDTPPALGILTINAFTASSQIIIPVEPAYFSLKGLVKLNEAIESVREFTNENLIVKGVLFTKYNENFNISKKMKEAASKISEVIGAPIFQTFIRRTIRVDEAQVAGVDLITFKTATTAEEDYKAFGKEYLMSEGVISDGE